MTETFNNLSVAITRDIAIARPSTLIPVTKIISETLYILNLFFLVLAIKKKAVSVMQTNKSTGPNSIQIRNQTIRKPLTYLINLSFANEIFQDLLKTLNIIPVFKRG